MKRAIYFLGLFLVLTIGHAQDVMQLEEVRVKFKPISNPFISQGNTLSFHIDETFVGEFEQDPITFMNKYFDIYQVIADLNVKIYESIAVSFKSQKGELNAEYDKSGRFLKTSMRFEDILVPYPLQHQLYRENKGWALVKTVHIVSGKNGLMKIDFYRLVMKNGKKKRRLKINAEEVEVLIVSSM